MQVVCDVGRCTGLGLCEFIAPDYFEVQADGTLALLRTEADDADRPSLEEAVRSCPTGALSTID